MNNKPQSAEEKQNPEQRNESEQPKEFSQQTMDAINRDLMVMDKSIISFLDTYPVHPGDLLLRLSSAISGWQNQKVMAAQQAQGEAQQLVEKAKLEAELDAAVREKRGIHANIQSPAEEQELVTK